VHGGGLAPEFQRFSTASARTGDDAAHDRSDGNDTGR
jgi:hypothetical protein